MRSQAGLNLVELRIAVVIIVVVALIAIPTFLSYSGDVKRKKGALDCLLALAAAVEKKDPAATCPASGKPFAPDFSCPDPGKHLQPDLRVERSAGGIALLQSLPPLPAAREIPGDGVSLIVESAGKPLQLRILNGAWYRWLWGPLAGLFLLFMAFVTAFETWDLGWREKRSTRIFQWGIVVLLVFGAVAAVGYFHRTVLLEIDGERGRVVRSVRALGLPCGSPVHEGVVGVAALKGTSTFEVLALRKSEKGFEGVVLVTIPEESLGLVRLCQERFLR